MKIIQLATISSFIIVFTSCGILNRAIGIPLHILKKNLPVILNDSSEIEDKSKIEKMSFAPDYEKN